MHSIADLDFFVNVCCSGCFRIATYGQGTQDTGYFNCANGIIGEVNIDSGYGAVCLAVKICRTKGKRTDERNEKISG